MKMIVPNYYNSFSCIAGKCRHSCCIGWEITVDNDMLEYYKSVDGEFGKALMDNIAIALEGDTSHFILSEKDRCPFLNKNNLCDIIINLGEDSLCQICADHPRYRNFFSDRIEFGLGLCCETAANLILTQNDKTTLVILSDDGAESQCDESDEKFFELRSRLLDIIQDRELPIDKRISEIFEICDIQFAQRTPRQWMEIYLGLERLDESWTEELNQLKELKNIPINIFASKKWEVTFEQLLTYFIYRHTADGLYDGRIKARIEFAVYALYIICLLCACRHCKNGIVSIDDFIDIARMYSAEIEYCEENINKLFDIFESSIY